MSIYYDRNGEPMDMMEWIAAFGDIKDRVIAHTPLADGGEVSTVWLGLDHSFGIGPPLIFETMVFGGPHDQEQWRYSTEEQALTGHRNAVEECGGPDLARRSLSSQ
jgi:hypothetical protein